MNIQKVSSPKTKYIKIKFPVAYVNRPTDESSLFYFLNHNKKLIRKTNNI